MNSGADDCEMAIPREISQRRYAVGPRIEEETLACALRCQMDVAGFTAASVPDLRRRTVSSAFARLSRSTGDTLGGHNRSGASFTSYCARAETFWLDYSLLNPEGRPTRRLTRTGTLSRDYIRYGDFTPSIRGSVASLVAGQPTERWLASYPVTT